MGQKFVKETIGIKWQDCFSKSQDHPELCPICSKRLVMTQIDEFFPPPCPSESSVCYDKLRESKSQKGYGKGDAHAKLRFFFFSSLIKKTHAETIKNRRSGSVAPHHLSWDRTTAVIWRRRGQ